MQSELLWDDNGESLVKSTLKSYVQSISDAIKESWQKYLDIEPDKRYPWDSKTRANVVNNYICHEIRHRFDNISGVSINDHCGFLVLNFCDTVLLRFKMLDKNRRAGNIQTKQQNDYDRLSELPHLPPKAIRVVAGYQLDQMETQIKDILITRPICGKILWYYPILSETFSTIQPTLAIKDAPKEQLSKKRIIRPKKLEKLDADNGSKS